LWELAQCHRWADVVFQNNIESRQLWPSLFYKKPLVIALHTWIRDGNGNRSPIQRLKQLSIFSADEVIAVSEAIRVDSFQKAEVISNPFLSNSFRKLLGINREHAIVFLGRLVSDKGVDMLLRAYAELEATNWRLSIIGDGPERASLADLAEALGIRSSVDFLGPIVGEDLVRVLNQHELMVVPSRWREPFGIVVLEGLACGCVVLASDGGGLPDAVGSAGLLFNRGDQSDLTNKLRLLIDDHQLRVKLQAKSAAHLANFQQEVVCAKYLQILERAVFNS